MEYIVIPIVIVLAILVTVAVVILNNYDESLKLIDKFEEVNSIIESIKEIATQIGNTEIVELANKVSL